MRIQKFKKFEDKLIELIQINNSFLLFSFLFKEAEQFLYDRTLSIQNENLQLRKALQELLKRTDALNESKQQLEEEQIRLIRQLRLAADLKRIRLNKIQSTINTNSSKSTPH
jgi:hypothetical protein